MAVAADYIPLLTQNITHKWNVSKVSWTKASFAQKLFDTKQNMFKMANIDDISFVYDLIDGKKDTKLVNDINTQVNKIMKNQSQVIAAPVEDVFSWLVKQKDLIISKINDMNACVAAVREFETQLIQMCQNIFFDYLNIYFNETGKSKQKAIKYEIKQGKYFRPDILETVKEAMGAAKALLTSCNKIIAAGDAASSKYAIKGGAYNRTGKGDYGTDVKSEDFQKLVQALSGSVITFYGQIVEPLGVIKGEITGIKGGFGDIEKEIYYIGTTTKDFMGNIKLDPNFIKDKNTAAQMEKEIQTIISSFGGRGKGDYQVTANGGRVNLQWKTHAMFSPGPQGDMTISAGSASTVYQALISAGKYGMTVGGVSPLQAALECNMSVPSTSATKVISNKNLGKYERGITSQQNNLNKILAEAKQYAFIDGVMGHGELIDSNLFYIIKTPRGYQMYSTLQIIYKALISNLNSGITFDGSDFGQNSLIIPINPPRDVQPYIQNASHGPNWDDAQGRSSQIYANASKIFSQKLGKIHINFLALGLNNLAI